MPKGGARPGAGRKPGKVSPTTALLKDAILKAAEGAGGKEGLIGYLTAQALANPAPFMSLLGRVLPMQVTGDGGGPLQIQRIERVIVDPVATNAPRLRAIAGGKPV